MLLYHWFAYPEGLIGTLANLQNPPPSYQQPAADLLDELSLIQRAVDANAFTNEYDFETAVLHLVQNAHDAHLSLNFGVSGIFVYGSAYAINSVSTDGIEPPRPYFNNDLLNAQAGGAKASPIVEINGQDAVEWLVQFAANNSIGLVDPNADWNALMQTPASDIQSIAPVFNGGTPFNPGDSLDFKLENGTVVQSNWLALIDIPLITPALSTGQDVFNFFVLGQFPDNGGEYFADGSADPPAATDAPSPTDGSGAAATSVGPEVSSTPTNWLQAAQVRAYPDDPFIVQPDLGKGGFLTGYFLKNSDVAVLKEMSDTAVSSFSNTVGQFLQQSQSAGKKKIVVGVQENFGRNNLLAVDAFKQFFPNIDPFTGSRMRSSPASNALGLTFTQFASQNQNTNNQSLVAEFTDLPWVVLDFTNAETEQPFASWPEYFGPHTSNNDFFSTTQRDNLSNVLFDQYATGGAASDTSKPLGIAIYGFGNRSNVSPQPYAASDVLILTDGVCQSSCVTFVEMIHHEAGVRTVAIGGRPNIGP